MRSSRVSQRSRVRSAVRSLQLTRPVARWDSRFMPLDPPKRADRVLICGRIIPSGTVGGLQLALADLAEGLARLGWDVDLAITPEALGLDLDTRSARRLSSWASPRWASLPRLSFLKGDARRILQHALLD